MTRMLNKFDMDLDEGTWKAMLAVSTELRMKFEPCMKHLYEAWDVMHLVTAAMGTHKELVASSDGAVFDERLPTFRKHLVDAKAAVGKVNDDEVNKMVPAWSTTVAAAKAKLQEMTDYDGQVHGKKIETTEKALRTAYDKLQPIASGGKKGLGWSHDVSWDATYEEVMPVASSRLLLHDPDQMRKWANELTTAMSADRMARELSAQTEMPALHAEASEVVHKAGITACEIDIATALLSGGGVDAQCAVFRKAVKTMRKQHKVKEAETLHPCIFKAMHSLLAA